MHRPMKFSRFESNFFHDDPSFIAELEKSQYDPRLIRSSFFLLLYLQEEPVAAKKNKRSF